MPTFRQQEDAAGYLAVLVQTALAHGLPLGIYSDRHTIFWRGKSGPAWPSSSAASARGHRSARRSKRRHRLISELRLAEARTIEDANAVLAD